MCPFLRTSAPKGTNKSLHLASYLTDVETEAQGGLCLAQGYKRVSGRANLEARWPCPRLTPRSQAALPRILQACSQVSLAAGQQLPALDISASLAVPGRQGGSNQGSLLLFPPRTVIKQLVLQEGGGVKEWNEQEQSGRLCSPRRLVRVLNVTAQ